MPPSSKTAKLRMTLDAKVDKKLGRNDLCWCGSGQKYKRCHLGRDKARPVSQQEILQAHRKAFGAGYCFHPNASKNDCGGKIIKAHTIQRNGGLNKIARDGHVYNCLLHRQWPFASNQRDEKPALVGAKPASTFTGFCARHDNLIFAPIEKYPFQASQEQIFLLSYRVICQELFLKKGTLEVQPFARQLDRGRGLQVQQTHQWMISTFMQGVKKAIDELEQTKAIFDESLLKSNFSCLDFYVIQFRDTPDLLCSGIRQPEFDFDGNRIQTLGILTRRAQWLYFSLIATDTGGAAVFSWLPGNIVCEKFVASFDSLADSAIPHAIVRYAFEFFENTYFSPDWWDRLDLETRSKLVERQRRDLEPNVESSRTNTCLQDDGIRAVNWTVESRLSFRSGKDLTQK
jgi:hypothetical protein